jgi:phosphoglycolate phosphatase-like HAD superfamily hydrolase
MIASRFELVIFDCDGVLVDSEPIINQAHVQVLTACGYPISEQNLVERFCGMSDREMLEIIEREWGCALPSSYAEHVGLMIEAGFRQSLAPIEGVAEARDSLTLPICVASSSSLEQILQKLKITGLLGHFPHFYGADLLHQPAGRHVGHRCFHPPDPQRASRTVHGPGGVAHHNSDALERHVELFSDDLGDRDIHTLAHIHLSEIGDDIAVRLDGGPAVELVERERRLYRGARRRGGETAGEADRDDKRARAFEEAAAVDQELRHRRLPLSRLPRAGRRAGSPCASRSGI